MEDNNTLKACYFYIADGAMHVKEKKYCWHIPKNLRAENIKKDDYVLVRGKDGRKKRMLVTAVFRENVEETGKQYKSILSKAHPVELKKDEIEKE
jgi:hypothetical protein